MRKTGAALLAAAVWLALSGRAYALEEPVCPHSDNRVCYASYAPGKIVHVWSTPEASSVIQFADDEVVFYVGASDTHIFKAQPRQNFLFWRAYGCMVKEPVQVLTHLPDGKLRLYLFQISTNPEICPPRPKKPADGDPQLPNLRLISQNALAPGSHEQYALIFRYPLDAYKKRQAELRAARARAERQRTEELLAQQTNVSGVSDYTGFRNWRYVKEGDMALAPQWIWDDGNKTYMIFPQNQRVPAVFRVNPDGHEATANPSAHGQGDTLIFDGTSPEWILRDGRTVLAIGNRGYNPIGRSPGTGTISPFVQRVLKGRADDR